MNRKRYRIPEPQIVTGQTEYGACYAWECSHVRLGLRVLGDTKVEAVAAFKAAVESEYPGVYAGAKE